MRASIRLEAIGDDTFEYFRHLEKHPKMPLRPRPGMRMVSPAQRQWIAEIIGVDSRYGWRRVFLRGYKDYTHANGPGSRGVFVTYILEPGRIYQVQSPQSWNHTDSYYCTVSKDGEIVRLNESEVLACLAVR